MSIVEEGNDFNDLMLSWLPGSRKPDKSRQGDIFWKNRFIESKKNTSNQTRAELYIPVIYYNEKRNNLYVIPANEVVRFVVKKPRGQHTELSMECCKLPTGKKALEKYQIDNTPKGLQKAIIKAFKNADEDMVAKEYCQKFNEWLKKIKEEYIKLQKECDII